MLQIEKASYYPPHDLASLLILLNEIFNSLYVLPMASFMVPAMTIVQRSVRYQTTFVFRCISFGLKCTNKITSASHGEYNFLISIRKL